MFVPFEKDSISENIYKYDMCSRVFQVLMKTCSDVVITLGFRKYWDQVAKLKPRKDASYHGIKNCIFDAELCFAF